MAKQVIIGMGSNLGEPFLQMSVACAELRNIPAFTNVRISSLYQTKPVGPQDQPDFINAVAIVETELEALQVLDLLQTLEQRHLRERKEHWGPRTLDLDILFYGDDQINTERLQVPHPEFAKRVFTVVPLLELVPDFVFAGAPLKDLVATLPIEDRQALKQLMAV
ncbi:MAG: 2-amino-4-hydroxy-6-hydroxymethyldihydropteridine diphosphokinase [Succinivibrionaceae bacterium]|nr:2-amino-4-hydroxy-6-hydroxymethyldihydropteridine diphosphokinase [Succinivibrionaceae bacterium]